MIGSEGILGIITQAWMRLQDRPTFRAGGAVRFTDFFTAARAVRAISQAGLYPSNCRILDPAEAYNTGAADGSVAIMVLAFEFGRSRCRAAWMKRARECCADHGGTPEASGAEAHRAGAAGAVAQRLHPHALRDGAADPARRHQRHVRDGDHLGSLRAIPRRDQERDRERDREATGRGGQVTCRFTHVYPDGPAPYFTFHALGRARQARRAMAHDQERGARRRDRERRHGHASSRGRARSSAVVRPAAPAAVRRGVARRQEGARSARPAQSRRADRSMILKAETVSEIMRNRK